MSPQSVSLALTLLASTASASIKTHFVFWNSTNPIFRLDNTDNVIDVNEGNLPWEYDQLNLICPQNSAEQHVIYSVSQDEYESCRVNNQRPKIVAICNKPETFQYFTITFRNFSPTPGGLEFKPGQSYYLISTSTSRDLHRRAGGFCASHNMKMMFKVADNERTAEEEPLAASSPLMRLLTSSSSAPAASTTALPIYYYRARAPTQESHEYNYYYSPRDLVKLRKKILGRTDENETLKAERLLSSSSSPLTASLALAVALALLLRSGFLQH